MCGPVYLTLLSLKSSSLEEDSTRRELAVKTESGGGLTAKGEGLLCQGLRHPHLAFRCPCNWRRNPPQAGSGSRTLIPLLLSLLITLSSLFLSKIHRVYELRLTDPPGLESKVPVTFHECDAGPWGQLWFWGCWRAVCMVVVVVEGLVQGPARSGVGLVVAIAT